MYPWLDLNRDGLVTRTDFQMAGAQYGPIGMAFGNQIFSRFDYNGDGVLNAYECCKASMALGGRFGPRYPY